MKRKRLYKIPITNINIEQYQNIVWNEIKNILYNHKCSSKEDYIHNFKFIIFDSQKLLYLTEIIYAKRLELVVKAMGKENFRRCE